MTAATLPEAADEYADNISRAPYSGPTFVPDLAERSRH